MKPGGSDTDSKALASNSGGNVPPDPSIRNDARNSSILVLLSAIAVSCALLGWIAADEFIDREEAQHVLRAIATFDGLFTESDPLTSKFLRLIEIRDGGHKQWYGWPYYLVVSVFWRAIGFHEDVAVGLNVLFLIASALLVRLIALRLGASPSGANAAALFLLFTPGVVVYAHLFVPSVFLLLLVAATAYAILRTEAWSRPWISAAAGAIAGLATVSKATLFFFWIPFAIWAIFNRSDRLFSRNRFLSVFAAVIAFSFAPLTFWRGREVLAVWRDRLEAIWSAGGWTESLRAAAIRWGELLLPVHIALVVVAIIALLVVRRFQTVILCAVVTLLPVIGVIASSGQPGTVRDYIPAILGPALLVGIAAGQGRRRALLASFSIVIFGALFLPINLFGRLIPADPSSKGIKLFSAAVEGVPWGIRLTPYPDLVGATIAAIDRLPMQSVSERCGCLSVLPYPAAGSNDRPLVGLDSLLLGPENLQVWLRFRGRDQAWQFGTVPYPLHCPAYQVAKHCMAALVIDQTTLGAHYPTAENLARLRRPEMQGWGVPAHEVQLAFIPRLEIRAQAQGEPICPASPAREAAVSKLLESCSDGDYYADFIRYQILGSTSQEVGSIRSAALERSRELDAGVDPMAVVFGERYLSEWTVAALPPSNGLRDTPPGAAGNIVRERGQPLPDSAFRVQWDLSSVPGRMKAGQTVRVPVKVRNLGTVKWPDPSSLSAQPVGALAVRLSSRWKTDRGGLTDWSARADLRQPLTPGKQTTLMINVAAPKKPGRYTLQFDLVQELVAWFSDRGAEEAMVFVEVTR